jgi:SAM-dependent methyltransferase
MNTTIQPHNERPAKVWSSGGAVYDEISRQIASALDHCVRRLAPEPGEQILDLATGTGWTARLIARNGAKVAGVDIAADLIAAAQAAGGGPEFEVGDAERLRFDDAAFDGIASTFGVMFASRPEAVAGELARVCRPGGRIALTVWRDDSNLAKMFGVMRPYMPPPPDPAPPSPFAWGNRTRASELLAKAFDLTFEEGVTVYHDRDGRAAWEVFLEGYEPTKMLAGSLDPDRRAQLKADFIAFHDGFATPLGLSMPREYLLIHGRRR